jgi:hypothetical protein
VSSDEKDRLRAIERVLGRKINVLPLDRSGIRIPAERTNPAQVATQAPRAARPQRAHQQRGHGQGQGGQGRRGGHGRGR